MYSVRANSDGRITNVYRGRKGGSWHHVDDDQMPFPQVAGYKAHRYLREIATNMEFDSEHSTDTIGVVLVAVEHPESDEPAEG